jgi:hypothetical protein
MSEDWWQKPLKFPEREIHHYAEHVPPADLTVGQVYFRLGYLDNEMRFPCLTPMVYIGRDLEPTNDGVHHLYFQDAASYLSGVRWDDPTPAIAGETEEERFESWSERAYFETAAESQGSGMYEFEKALNSLLLCSLRRRGLVRAPPLEF